MFVDVTNPQRLTTYCIQTDTYCTSHIKHVSLTIFFTLHQSLNTGNLCTIDVTYHDGAINSCHIHYRTVQSLCATEASKRYGIVEFNIPVDTLQVISEMILWVT